MKKEMHTSAFSKQVGKEVFIILLIGFFLVFSYFGNFVSVRAVDGEDYCDANNFFHLKQGGTNTCAGGCDKIKGCCGTLNDDCCTEENSDDAECGENLICVDDFCKDINETEATPNIAEEKAGNKLQRTSLTNCQELNETECNQKETEGVCVAIMREEIIPAREEIISGKGCEKPKTVIIPENRREVYDSCTKNGTLIESETSETEEVLGFKYLIKNGRFDEKLDVLFISFNISEKQFNESINNVLYAKGKETENVCGNIYSRGLFEVEPFKQMSNKFNVEIFSNQLNFDEFECHYSVYYSDKAKLNILCNWEKLKSSLSFKPDIIVLIGEDFTTAADKDVILMGDPFSDSAAPDASYEDSFVHEFGHAFGGLTDEYTYSFTYNCGGDSCYYVTLPDQCVNSDDSLCFSQTEKEISVIPNEDVAGCSKWCASYDKKKLEEISSECTKVIDEKTCIVDAGCIWFKQKHPWFDANCVPRKLWEDIGISCSSQCLLGQHFRHLSFSPDCSEGGMMSNQVGDFNEISQKHLRTSLECCFPKSSSSECKEFSEKFNLSSDINPYFKFAYDKFAECYKS